ncbi:MAG TPA: NAD(P)/FAD-dependent oxidoreductase [Bacteroidia bacterium]|nr:NAD(P)/FAD-dependent oxidoreductase [Bacteroidia bacterium]
MIIPQTNKKRVLIAGGGFGGIQLAKRLSQKLFHVVMIDKNNFHTFQPLLYQVATGGLEPDSIAYPIRKIFARRKNFVFRMAEAIEVKSDQHILLTSIGEIPYDFLVIATGSTTNYFGNNEIQNNSISLKGVTDALDLRSLILQNFEKMLTEPNEAEKSKYLNIVIAGGGPTGVETAGALAELKKHVLPNDYPELDFNCLNIHVIEAGEKILSTMSSQASRKSKEFLLKMGVKVWLKTKVDSYIDNMVTLNDGQKIDCNIFIWTAGVMGNIIKGISNDLILKGNRFKVDVYNRLTGYEDIFIIGDAAAMTDEDGNPAANPMVAPVAIQQAKNLARNLNGKKSSWKKFYYRDLGTMATIGRNKAVADFKIIKLQGIIAWFIWMFVHLMSIVGFRNRVIVFINWVWNYFSYDRAIRLIIRPYKKKREAEEVS